MYANRKEACCGIFHECHDDMKWRLVWGVPVLNPKTLEVGKRYVIQITGFVRPAVGECVGHDSRYGWGMLKVLNKGFMEGAVLKREDYIPEEEYDPTKHDPIEGEKPVSGGIIMEPVKVYFAPLGKRWFWLWVFPIIVLLSAVLAYMVGR
jgi:hypothetical protein